MGLLTDFFLADQGQLASIFRGWLTVADEPVEVDGVNPFTGEPATLIDWPTTGQLGDGPPDELSNLSPVPHVMLKRVDPVKLAVLHHLLTAVDVDEASDALHKPALKHPTNEECGLHELPPDLAAALGDLAPTEIGNLAGRWAESEEMIVDMYEPADCVEIIQALHDLAARATPAQQMYLLWSL